MTTTHLSHPRYRPDIDGLRAIAILLVVIYHAFPRLAPGGFVGVDLFFVISGYLISTIIFKSLERDAFTFREFYARRVKRIFPAFIFVTLSVLIAGWVVLFPDEFWRTGKDAFNANLFILNITLIHGGGYFDMASATRPFLHLWSLGVEEQYYLLWPVILVAAWRIPRYRAAVIGLVFVLSFVANVALLQHSRDMAFYFPVSRFWQLLTGGALAYAQLHRIDFSLPRWSSWCGIAAIVLSVFLLNDDRMFPGFWALLPTLGAAALIGAGQNAVPNRYVLSAKPMRWIGLISYPLYLWHWPVLAYFKIVNDASQLNAAQTLAALILSIALAAMTFFVVETPLRVPRTAWLKRHATALLAVLWIALLALSLAIYKKAVPARMTLDPARAKIAAAIDNWDYPDRDLKSDAPQTLVLNAGQDNTVLFAGDSHVAMLWPYLKHVAAAAPQNAPTLRVAAYGGCDTFPFVPHPNAKPFCAAFRQSVADEMQRSNVTAIVFNLYWEKFFAPLFRDDSASTESNAVLDQWANDLKTLVDAGKRVYIVLPMPAGPDFDPKKMLPRIGAPRPATAIDAGTFYQRAAPFYKAMQNLAHRSGAQLLDPLAAMCPHGQCPAVAADGRPLYKDADHMRPFAIIGTGGFLQPALRK